MQKMIQYSTEQQQQKPNNTKKRFAKELIHSLTFYKDTV